MDLRSKTISDYDTLLGRLAGGDAAARDAIVAACFERITQMSRRELRAFPRVARWEQTDDVAQGVAQRLHRALAAVVPPSTKDLLRLCAELIRRELIDLKRRHFGPEGIGCNHHSPAPAGSAYAPAAMAFDVPDTTFNPSKLAEWTELHQVIGNMAEDHRDVFDLIWYHEFTREEAAEVLGVSAKTVSRRWRDARLRLIEKLGGSVL